MENIPDLRYGKMSPAHSRLPGDVTIVPCLRRSQKPKFQYLDLGGGQMPEWCEAEALTSLGACTMHNNV